MKRKAISKRTRFEVFKRDSFKCQYCGRTAPEIVLVIDHVHPVAAGGLGDVLNLITSCDECNSGKSVVPLSDSSAITRQRKELDALAERREQMEMMVRWRAELQRGAEILIDSLCSRVQDMAPFTLNDTGRACLRKWMRKYSYDEIMDSIEAAFEQYYRPGDAGTWEFAFRKIPNICHCTRAKEEKPYLDRLFYIRGILKNRLSYCDPHKCVQLLERAVLANASLDSLQNLAMEVRSWTAFRQAVEIYLSEHEGKQQSNSEPDEPDDGKRFA